MQILQDENLREKPIGSALNYTWAALSANWKNSAVIAGLLLLLSLFQAIPMVGMIAAIAQGIVSSALAYWVVEKLTSSTNLKSFKEGVESAGPKEMLFRFIAPASGFYLGIVITTIIFMAATALIFWLIGGSAMFGIFSEQMSGDQMTIAQTTIFETIIPVTIFILVTATFFGYIWPLVYGYALLQRSFSDALNALFMLFSTRFWRAAFTMQYFKVVSLWMLILFGAMLLAGICTAFFILIPVAVLILLWLTYFSAIVAAETYNFSDDI